jgi:hypothetical protein
VADQPPEGYYTADAREVADTVREWIERKLGITLNELQYRMLRASVAETLKKDRP